MHNCIYIMHMQNIKTAAKSCKPKKKDVLPMTHLSVPAIRNDSDLANKL
jgi:hypothetical protein